MMERKELENIKNDCYEIWDILKDKKNIVEVLITSQTKNKQLEEQLVEQQDFKDEYYYYWQQVKKENKQLKEEVNQLKEKLDIIDEALEFACQDLSKYEELQTTLQIKKGHYFDKAKNYLGDIK